MRLPILASLGTVLLLASVALPAAAQTPPTRTLTVFARVEVQAVPDRAEIQLGVETRAATAQAAMAQNSAAIDRVIVALKQLGIPETNLQTSIVNLQPIYNAPAEGSSIPPALAGFEATNIVRVQLRDLTRVGPTIDAGITAGANRVLGISFGVQDEERVRLTALRQAGASARAKAEALAAGFGLTLGEVDAVIEVGPPSMLFAADRGASSGTPVLPGTITLQIDVQVRYALAR